MVFTSSDFVDTGLRFNGLCIGEYVSEGGIGVGGFDEQKMEIMVSGSILCRYYLSRSTISASSKIVLLRCARSSFVGLYTCM